MELVLLALDFIHSSSVEAWVSISHSQNELLKQTGVFYMAVHHILSPKESKRVASHAFKEETV